MKFKNILKKINLYAIIGVPMLFIGAFSNNVFFVCIGFGCAILDMGNNLQKLYDEEYKNN